jgi:hypothetical protein
MTDTLKLKLRAQNFGPDKNSQEEKPNNPAAPPTESNFTTPSGDGIRLRKSVQTPRVGDAANYLSLQENWDHPNGDAWNYPLELQSFLQYVGLDVHVGNSMRQGYWPAAFNGVYAFLSCFTFFLPVIMVISQHRAWGITPIFVSTNIFVTVWFAAAIAHYLFWIGDCTLSPALAFINAFMPHSWVNPYRGETDESRVKWAQVIVNTVIICVGQALGTGLATFFAHLMLGHPLGPFTDSGVPIITFLVLPGSPQAVIFGINFVAYFVPCIVFFALQEMQQHYSREVRSIMYGLSYGLAFLMAFYTTGFNFSVWQLITACWINGQWTFSLFNWANAVLTPFAAAAVAGAVFLWPIRKSSSDKIFRTKNNAAWKEV